MRFLGIDPGSVSAAFAILDDNGRRGPLAFIVADDIPVVDRMVNAVGFDSIVRQFKPTIAIVERVGTMPKQGISSAFRFGMGCGLIRGVLAGCCIPIYDPPPTVWKKHFALNNDGEKSRALAIKRFPAAAGALGRKKDHGRAEALLLALWRYETGGDGVAAEEEDEDVV